MTAIFIQRLALELDRHKPLTMAEANLQWETAKVDFENLLLDSDNQGYQYEPEYSQEELTQIEEEAGAAATEQALPVAEDEEPERADCSVCLTKSLCCSEFQRCKFLLE